MRRQDPIRVLVIDDSAFSRRTITGILERSPLVEVMGWASDGEEALRKTIEATPDLVTLDLEMPRMDGLTYLRLMMSRLPTPVIVISGQSRARDVFQALDLGAVDFITKPTLRDEAALRSIEQELLRKVHAIRQLRIEKVQQRLASAAAPEPVSVSLPQPPAAIAIGSSTGGPSALMQIFGSFLEPLPLPVLVSQHMPAGFTRGLAERLDRMTPFQAVEARDGERLQPGRILIAPGGTHLELESSVPGPVVRITPPSAEDRYVPSVDRLFASASKHFGERLLAIVLTGMGDDGREGVRAVKRAGGTVFAESEETSVIHGMPLQAIRTGVVDRVLPLPDIAGALRRGLEARHAFIGMREGSS